MIMCLLSTWLLGICSGTRSSWDSSPPACCKNQSPCHLSSSLFSFSFLFLCLWMYLSECILFLCLWPTWHLYLNCLPRKSIALPLSSLLGEPVQGFFFRWKITHFCKIWFKGSLTNAPIRESSLPQVSYLDRQFRWKSLCQRGIHWKCRFNIT